MIRIFDTDTVSLVGDNTKKNKQRLDELITELKGFIHDITTYYRGVDAEQIILKYNNLVQDLELISSNFENCSKFLTVITGKYSDSFNKAKKNIEMINPEVMEDNSSFYNNGLAFNNVSEEVVDGVTIETESGFQSFDY